MVTNTDSPPPIPRHARMGLSDEEDDLFDTMYDLEALLAREEFPNLKVGGNWCGQTYTSLDHGTSKFVLGQSFRFWTSSMVESPANQKHGYLYVLCKRLIALHDPSFTYTCIQVNRNVNTRPHRHATNVGMSYGIGLGDFEGGGLILNADDPGSTSVHDNRRKFVRFDGGKSHATQPVITGQRFAIIYYTMASRT